MRRHIKTHAQIVKRRSGIEWYGPEPLERDCTYSEWATIITILILGMTSLGYICLYLYTVLTVSLGG